MPYLKDKSEVINLESDPNYWIKLQTALSWGEMKKISTVSEDGKNEYQIDAMLLACIKDWNLDDEAGEKLEITPENIDKLGKPDIEQIVTALGASLQEPEAQKKSS